MEKKLEIAHFTDPLCFWCYAMEPETGRKAARTMELYH